MVPGALGLGAVQINVLVNTYLASSQQEGAVSWLGYAFRLMYLPIGLFGVSIATASLPDISRHAVADDLASIRRTVSRGLRMILMLNVPATLGLIALAEPIVSLLYERNRFGPADTVATAAALMFYAPGLLGYSAVKIASPTFYSLRDSRTPVIVSALSVAVNLITQSGAGSCPWLQRPRAWNGTGGHLQRRGSALAAASAPWRARRPSGRDSGAQDRHRVGAHGGGGTSAAGNGPSRRCPEAVSSCGWSASSRRSASDSSCWQPWPSCSAWRNSTKPRDGCCVCKNTRNTQAP